MDAKKILVVDDEPDAVAYLQALLEDHAYTVVSAHSVEKGHKVLEADKPDLVLADVMLPGVSGLDLVLRIRKDPKWNRLPVVVITGEAAIVHDRCRSYLERYEVSPPDAILEKPFDPKRLLETLGELLEA